MSGTDLAYLRRIPVFEDLAPEDLQLIIRVTAERRIARNLRGKRLYRVGSDFIRVHQRQHPVYSNRILLLQRRGIGQENSFTALHGSHQ